MAAIKKSEVRVSLTTEEQKQYETLERSINKVLESFCYQEVQFAIPRSTSQRVVSLLIYNFSQALWTVSCFGDAVGDKYFSFK